MPTGYTYPINESIEKGLPSVTLKAFAMQCAKAFLWQFRDSDLKEVPIEGLKPSAYHVEAEARLKLELATIESLTVEQALEKQQAESHDRAERKNKCELEAKAIRAEQIRLLAEIEAWNPPTEKHQNIKKFMSEQIRTAWSDGETYEEPPVPQVSAMAYISQEKARIHKDLEYHSTELAKEIERNLETNKWIKDLRDSLEGVPA